MNYNTYLRSHKQLCELNTAQPWDGSLYLPPCSCHTNTKCAESINPDKYDFSKFGNIHLSSMVNLCKFIDAKCESYTAKSLMLCSKYSITNNDFITSLSIDKTERVVQIQQSQEYNIKRKLLQNDLKLLFPLSGSLFIFKTRDSKHTCKFDILCNMKYNYIQNSKNKSSKGITRNCKTSKALHSDQTCKFQISVFFDIYELHWFLKWRGNIHHTHHNFTPFEKYSIGMSQLSPSMISEINKLQKSSVPSSIQQNILMTNNDISVPIMTILNKQNSQKNTSEKQHTDFENLLHILRSRQDITYFVINAKSMNTPLLSIKKPSASKRAINNNISIQGYIKVYDKQEKPMLPPKFDSHQQKILKDLLTTNKSTNEVEVILAIGWARDNELSVFRKFPEVVKMDCTHSTNREERPLFNLVAKDSNNKVYTVMRCLLPSEKSAIFNSLLVTIIPQIFGKDTCNKLNVIITDGDSQEIKAAQNACKLVFKNAVHINCFWHMIHQAVNKTKVIYNPQLKHIVKHWLYFTARYTESKEEQTASIVYLKVRCLFGYLFFIYHYLIFIILLVLSPQISK